MESYPLNLIYHPEAEEELIDAAQNYEKSGVGGLGARFLTEFDQAIQRIRENPFQFQIEDSPNRRYVMKNFPFNIYYQITDIGLQILAVKHHSRHPDYWKKRQPLQYIKEVEKGTEFLITKRGEAVARLVPVERKKKLSTEQRRDVLRQRRSFF